MRSLTLILIALLSSLLVQAQDGDGDLDSAQYDASNTQNIAIMDTLSLQRIPLSIHCEEDDHHRWMTLSFHDINSREAIQNPHLTFDKSSGSFEIRFEDLINVPLVADRLFKDHGHFPIQYQISFKDSSTLIVTGKTLAFQHLKLSYSFNSAEYTLDFIYSDQPAPVAQLAPSTQTQTLREEKRPTAAQPSQIPRRSNELKKLFNDSLVITSIAMMVLLLLGVSGWLYQKRKRRKTADQPRFADVLDGKTEAVKVEPTPVRQPHDHLAPELREVKIRELMNTQNLTYDEATLRFQYSGLKEDDE